MTSRSTKVCGKINTGNKPHSIYSTKASQKCTRSPPAKVTSCVTGTTNSAPSDGKPVVELKLCTCNNKEQSLSLSSSPACLRRTTQNWQVAHIRYRFACAEPEKVIEQLIFRQKKHVSSSTVSSLAFENMCPLKMPIHINKYTYASATNRCKAKKRS